ncbi:MAG TPA: terminase small subunit [Hanamia sp.]|nr:terminase small subunit [Hanamia sp.]
MKSKKNKISKQKGVELCADFMYTGQKTNEIVRSLTESYGISRSAVEKWMKAARPVVEERQKEAERIMAIENEVAIRESASRLNLSRERILEEYAKLAFFDIRKIFTVDGGLMSIKDIDDESAAAISGIESYDEKVPDTQIVLGTMRKIKIAEKKGALDSLCKVLGYNLPEKIAQTDKDGNDISRVLKVEIVKPIE